MGNGERVTGKLSPAVIDPIDKLHGILADGPDLIELLLQDRAKERTREEDRLAEFCANTTPLNFAGIELDTQILSATHGQTRAAALLRAGKLVAFPTDTVYGVGTIFSDQAAVERIYVAKGRPESKGIPILLASPDDLPLVAAEVNETATRLAAAFWPGPLTLILPKAPAVPPAVSQTPTVAVRVPDHPLARTLIAAAGAPLAVTSANRSGEPPTTDPAVVHQTLGRRIAAVLDGGIAPGGVSSTVVDCTSDPPRILRSGPITAATIIELLNDSMIESFNAHRN